jgi:NCAIR mutase (PurE)-related protein
MYGPGEITFDLSNDGDTSDPTNYANSQKRIADDLEAAQRRVQKARDEEAALQASNSIDTSTPDAVPAPGLSVEQVQAMIQNALTQQKQSFIDAGLLKLPDASDSGTAKTDPDKPAKTDK